MKPCVLRTESVVRPLQGMAALRTTCLKCAFDISVLQAVDPDAIHCQRCLQPINVPGVVVSNTCMSSLGNALFNRLGKPRPVGMARTTIQNVSVEQFSSWMRDGWLSAGTSKRPKEDRDDWLVQSWEDVKELCRFEVMAEATQDPSQGLKNIRASARGELAIVVPPIILSHR